MNSTRNDFACCSTNLNFDEIFKECKEMCKEHNYKTCIYIGKNTTNWKYLRYLDYLKLGSYINDLGGLNCKTTNQRMYKIEDITPMISPTIIKFIPFFTPKNSI